MKANIKVPSTITTLKLNVNSISRPFFRLKILKQSSELDLEDIKKSIGNLKDPIVQNAMTSDEVTHIISKSDLILIKRV